MMSLSYLLCLVAVMLSILCSTDSFRMMNSFKSPRTLLSMSTVNIGDLGGKIVVTGIGKFEEDEFMLSLLNEQRIWTAVILATDDAVQAKKKFLSRTARYSGLLNILEFATFVDNKSLETLSSSSPPSSESTSSSTAITTTSNSNQDQLSSLLKDANAWIGFNVSRANIPLFSKTALDAGVQRVIFTTELSPSNINDTNLPEFADVAKIYEEAGRSFTGIRHGVVVDGDEDKPYEIVNASIPVLETFVERGILSRVTAELLLLDKSANKECGVSASSEFARAYLNVLRSSGLSRAQEVDKMFSGGLQRVAQLTVNEYDAESKRAEERKQKVEARRLEIEKENEEEALATTNRGPMSIRDQLGLLDEEEFDFPPTDEEIIAKRANEIMMSVWAELEARMVTRSTSKAEFMEKNRAKSTELALAEFKENKSKKMAKLMELRSTQDFLDQHVDATRRQYAKLLNMERKEMQNQKEISDTWVKYIYLLLSVTMKQCTAEGKLFYNIDEFGQTMLLREEANNLRRQCNLESYEVIYDPLDASVIVSTFSKDLSGIGKELGLDKPADQLLPTLEEKYGKLLKSVPALRGATQIIEIAVETLKRELPPPPPTVAELRATESQAKQEMVKEMRFAAMRGRGKPTAEGQAPSVVGKL